MEVFRFLFVAAQVGWGGGNRENMGKLTECCNCADGNVLAPLPPRKRGGAAATKGAQEDRATESQHATNPKPSKAARGAERGTKKAAGQGDLMSFFRPPTAAASVAKKKRAPLPNFASKAAAAAAGDNNMVVGTCATRLASSSWSVAFRITSLQ